MSSTSSEPSQKPPPQPAAATAQRPVGHRHAPRTDQPAGADLGRRLHGLVTANLAVTANLTLREVLAQIVESARDLLDCDYAALGVIGDDGRLAQFLHLGMDEDEAAALGDLPRGEGILGLLVDDPRPLRLPDLGAHPASSGFPAGHPPMRSFIGAPIRVRALVFGNIYLTDKRGGGPFTADDEELLVALAANAAVAVDHARLHDELVRTQAWQLASARITTALLSQQDPGDVLRMVMSEGRVLVNADDVHVTRRTLDREETLQPIGVVTDRPSTAGTGAAGSGTDGPGPGRPLEQTTGRPPPADPGCRIAVPLVVGGPSDDVLVVSRRTGREPFDAHELQTVVRFAAQVAVALELQSARDDRERVRLVAEHHRIARDMHDHVIGRLVGTGMAVQGLARYLTAPDGQRRLAAHLDDLDSAVRDIRTLIYGLDGDPSAVWTLSARVLQVVEEATSHLGFAPEVDVHVEVEPDVGSTVPGHLLGVLREALANVVRHADAHAVQVRVTCTAHQVDLRVSDDGKGPPDARRPPSTSGGHGLVNMTERAVALDGRFSLARNESGGATLHWAAPTRRTAG